MHNVFDYIALVLPVEVHPICQQTMSDEPLSNETFRVVIGWPAHLFKLTNTKMATTWCSVSPTIIQAGRPALSKEPSTQPIDRRTSHRQLPAMT